MKAKVIETGKIIMVEECGFDYNFYSKIFRDKSGNRYLSYDLEFIETTYTPDWEQRRYELAKAALNGMLAHSRNGHGYHPRDPQMNWHDAIAEESIEIADAVIEKLKKL